MADVSDSGLLLLNSVIVAEPAAAAAAAEATHLAHDVAVVCSAGLPLVQSPVEPSRGPVL